MANMLEQSLNPRPVSGPSVGMRGPESGIDYFGDVGQRVGASLRRPGGVGAQMAPRRQPPPRAAARVTQLDPGFSNPAASDREAPGAGLTSVDTTVPNMQAPGGHSNISSTGGPETALSRGILGAAQWGRAIPGPIGMAAGMISGMDSATRRHQASLAAGEDADMSGFLGMAGGAMGAPSGALQLGADAIGGARRQFDDNPDNDPTMRGALGTAASYAVAQAPSEVRGVLGLAQNVNMATQDEGQPGAPSATGVNVTTRAALAARVAQAQAAARAQAQAQVGRNAPAGTPGNRVSNESYGGANLGLPNVPDSLPGGEPGWGDMSAENRASLDQAQRNIANMTDRGGQGGRTGNFGGTNNSAGGGFGGSGPGNRGFAADGGMATSRGFSRPGLPQANRQPRPMRFNNGGQVPMGVPMGSAPDERDVQTRVQQTLRDPQAVQQLLALPMSLMESGELTPEEVMTLGRVAEAAMYNPALYPQLRAFVAQQGMTPLPAAFDPSVITNIMVISKALQAQMPATEPGMVPGMDQAQVEQPVPGFGNGGYIRGPGTGRSDSIGTVNETSGAPVKVATDEYIIPAHVVRAKGRDFFDGLLRKYTQVGQE